MTQFNYIDCYDCYNRDISPSGYDMGRSVSHGSTRGVRLLIGELDIPLHMKTRNFSSSVSMKYTGKGVSWEVWNPDKHNNNFTNGWWAEDYQGSLNDIIHDVRADIIYMDLRNDLVVLKEIESEITLESTGIDTPEILPQNTPGIVDRELFEYVKFPGVSLSRKTTTRHKLLIGAEVRELASTIETVNDSVNLVLNFTKYFRIQTKFVDLDDYYDWQPYFIDSVPNPAADGYDWFEPFWMDPYVSVPLDGLLNDLFRQYYGSTGTGSFVNALTDDGSYKSPGPQGSWAVDLAGNVFVSQKIGDTYFNRILNDDETESDPMEIMSITGTDPRFYPVAPL